MLHLAPTQSVLGLDCRTMLCSVHPSPRRAIFHARVPRTPPPRLASRHRTVLSDAWKLLHQRCRRTHPLCRWRRRRRHYLRALRFEFLYKLLHLRDEVRDPERLADDIILESMSGCSPRYMFRCFDVGLTMPASSALSTCALLAFALLHRRLEPGFPPRRMGGQQRK